MYMKKCELYNDSDNFYWHIHLQIRWKSEVQSHGAKVKIGELTMLAGCRLLSKISKTYDL